LMLFSVKKLLAAVIVRIFEEIFFLDSCSRLISIAVVFTECSRTDRLCWPNATTWTPI